MIDHRDQVESSDRGWRGRIGGSLCAAVASGSPFHIDFLGSGSFDQLGAVVGIVAALGLATWWLFRRDATAPQPRPTVAPGVAAAMWDELEAAEESASTDDDVVSAPTT